MSPRWTFAIQLKSPLLTKEWRRTRMPSFVATPGAWTLATVVSTVGIAISTYNMFGHLRHYTAPALQKDIVRLLFIIPLYGVCSILSLILVEASPYLEVIRDVYEAFVIYCFFNLMLTFGGGEHHITVELMSYDRMKHPIPLCWLPPLTLNAGFVKGVKRGTLQFVVIKLVSALISVILLATGEYENPIWQTFNLVVYNSAYTIALYALLLFYMATRDFVSTMSPAQKFLAVKTIVFFTYWQGLLVRLAPISTQEANRWNDFILCLEMPFFAIMQYYAFPWYEFQTGVPDFDWLEAAGEIMSVRDVAQDIYHNIKPVYQEYTLNQHDGVVDLQGKYVGAKKKKYKTKTFLIGNLDNDIKTRRKKSRMPTRRGSKSENKSLRNIEKNSTARPLTDLSVVGPTSPMPELDAKPDESSADRKRGEPSELYDDDLEIDALPVDFPPEGTDV
ncbi:hypothetical protein AAMO2058_000147800 [Amorphochlora amoebiformis]